MISLGRLKLVKRIFSFATSKEIWYHSTRLANLPIILKEGLKLNQARHYTPSESKIDKVYGGITPIFLSKNPNHYEGANLHVMIDPTKLTIDVGGFFDYFPCKIEDDHLLFERYVYTLDELKPWLHDDKLFFKDVFSNEDLKRKMISVSGTAAYMGNIPVDDIVNKDALIKQYGT